MEVYHLVDGRYELLPANDREHYPIVPLGVELGIWKGWFFNQELPWLRWWDAQGRLLPTPEERMLRLAERLRAAGIDPDGE